MKWMWLGFLAACGTPDSGPTGIAGDDDDGAPTPTDTDLPTGTSDAPGLAMIFSGTDRVVADAASLPTGGEARTVQAWIRTDRADVDQSAVSWGDGIHTFGMGTHQGRLRVTAGTAEIDGPGMADGRWTHAAVTYDGSTVELFVDNVSAGTVDVALDTTASELVVGESFDGMVDELRIYGTDRMSSDIGADARQELDGDETGLLLYWSFNGVTASGSGERVQNEATATGPSADGLTEGSDTTPGPVQSDAW